MPLLHDLIATGRIADLILALMAVEAMALAIYGKVTGAGIAPSCIIANSLAGAFLILALRAALANNAAIQIAIWLAAALLAHVCDLALRWRVSGR
jgi:hypothetical protein